MNPLVSVVIATYNYGRYFGQAFDSVLAQSYRDFEIVVIDDGSTDGTRETHMETVKKASRNGIEVRYIYQENLGQPAAKNRGIRESRGEIIAFLDADDIWMRDKLEKQIPLFDDPRTGVVYSRRMVMDPEGRIRKEKDERHLYRGDVLQEIFIDNFVCFSTSCVRASCLSDARGFDESLVVSIDYDLWLRISRSNRFDYVDKELVMYRTGHGNLSSRKELRFNTAFRIAGNFLEKNPGVIGWRSKRAFYSQTYSNFGYWLRNVGRRSDALGAYVKSLAYSPINHVPIKGMIACMFPGLSRRWGKHEI